MHIMYEVMNILMSMIWYVYIMYMCMHAILDIHNYNTMGIISVINVARYCDCIVNTYNTHCIVNIYSTHNIYNTHCIHVHVIQYTLYS